jgi:hypothetical protein
MMISIGIDFDSALGSRHPEAGIGGKVMGG